MSLWAFRCLLWYICVMLVQPQNRFTVLWPLHIAEVTFVMAVVFHVLTCVRDKKPILRMGVATGLGLVLIFLAFVANYGSPYQDRHDWNPFFDYLVKNALLMLMVEAMCTTVRRVWAVQMVSLVCTLWWLKAGLRLSAAGATFSGDRMMGAAVGLIENPNSFAYMMCVFLPLYLYAFEVTKRKWLKWCFMAGALVGVYIVFQTGSRTGLVTLVVMGIFSIPHYRRIRWRNVAMAAVAITLIFPLTGEQNKARFKTIPQSVASFFGKSVVQDGPLSQDQLSSEERKGKNRDTWKMIRAYPLFGVGFYPKDEILISYPMARGHVHCEILMAGKQMGFIGMGMYLGFLAIAFFCGMRIQKTFRDWPEVGNLGWVFCMQSLLILVGGSFCPLPWHPPMMALAGSASALATLAKRRRERVGVWQGEPVMAVRDAGGDAGGPSAQN